MADKQQQNLEQSQSYVESLKEALGIRTRLTESEKYSFDIAKQAIKAIADQKTGLLDLNATTKQIVKNESLIEKNTRATLAAKKSLGIQEKISYNLARKTLQTLEEDNKKRDEIFEKLNLGQQISQNELNTLNDKIALEEDNLKLQTSTLSPLGKQALYQEQITQQLVKENKEREVELELLQQIERSMGFLGRATKALGELPVIGSAFTKAFGQAQEKIKEIVKETGKVPGKAQSALIMFQELGDVIQGLAVTFLIKAMLDLNKTMVDFQRATGYSRLEVGKLNYEIQAATISEGELYTTSTDVLKSINEITKQTGVLGTVIGAKAAVGASVLKEQMGLSAEAAGQFATTAAISRKDVQETAKGVFETVNAYNDQNRTALSAQQILEKTASVSKDIGANFAFSNTKLAEAVTSAQALGLSLEDVRSVGDNLLNFESSITAELEAELLIGRDINLEKARQLALNNDLKGLAEELKKQNITALDYSRMNRFQQEATAKAMGMSSDQLSKTLYQQELNNLSAEEYKAIYGEQNYEAAKQLNIQQRLEKALTKIADAFTPVIEGIAAVVSNAGVLFTILGAIAAIKLFNLGEKLGFTGKAAGGVDTGKTLTKTLNGLGKGLQGLGKAVANPQVILGLAAVTLSLMGIGKALQYATPAIESIGKVILGVFSQIPTIITAVAQGFVAILNAITLEKAAAMLVMSGSLFALAGGLTAFALALAGAGIAEFLAGDGVLLGLERLAAIADPITNVAAAIQSLTTNLAQFNGTLNNLDEDKLEALSEFGEKSAIASAFGGTSSAAIGPVANLTGGGSRDSTAVELREIKAVLQQILAKEGSVYIDSTKAGTGFAIGTSKLQ